MARDRHYFHRRAQMKKVAIAACLLFLATAAHAAENKWLSREFSNGWSIPGSSVENFLNVECRPAGLDGIQIVAIQKGHDSPYNLHVYCRQDRSATVRYKVTMNVFPKTQIDAAVNEWLVKPNVRIGPFRFGDEGEGDGFLVVEKIR